MSEVASWQPDVLGPGYEMMTLALEEDYEGEVTATLVRRPADRKGRRAVLYVHGYNDYFFQKHVADFYTGLGISFYALDLRKHGRSLLPHQTACLCLSLREYYPEIDAAVDLIKREGHELVLVSGHSTGGLVVSLWAAEDGHRNLVAGLILNSPYLSSGVPAAVQLVVDPACRMIARRNPAAAFPLRLSPRYSRSLHRSYQGDWDFNTAWKSVSGTRLRMAWLASIHAGQRRVREGLGIAVPVLVLCATASGNRKTPAPELFAVDIVLDVGQIARLSPKLGRNVTCIRITGAIHDVFLSQPAARRRAFDELSNWLTATPLARDEVVDRLDRGPAGVKAEVAQNGHQRHAELVEVLLRLPDVEYLKLVAGAEARVVQAARGLARTGGVQARHDLVVLHSGHGGGADVDAERHEFLHHYLAESGGEDAASSRGTT